MNPESRIRQQLEYIYGEKEASRVWEKLEKRIHDFLERRSNLTVRPPGAGMCERDVILITYADQVQQPGRSHLQTLNDFLTRWLPHEISGVHLLPFFPYSSDDGFSVIDYRRVDPQVGSWEDIALLGTSYRLMFDAVVNHISQHSEWFQGFLRGEQPYRDYFITVEPETDLRRVVRPRTLPLLSPFETASGPRLLWTTFSEDQVDLNYANPEVLVEMADLLLYYVERGAEIIRLDAIAYLWKEPGTPCLHLPRTHAVVKLFRAVLDAAAPHVLLITETNVPHQENISYFGQRLDETGRTDEAQLVYQFPLAPLAVHTLQAGSCERLRAWAAELDTSQLYFNFIASHDGIGMMPAHGLLAAEDIEALINQTLAHNGQVSYKNNPDGTRSVYELNITLYDLLNNPSEPDPTLDPFRFLASQALMLSLAGLPGIYFHSLFGSRSCQTCLEETGRARTLNREKFDLDSFECELKQPGSKRWQVFNGYRRMLRVRRGQPAFHPRAGQQVLDLGEAVFAVLRTPADKAERVLCLVNVTTEPQEVALHVPGMRQEMEDLLSDWRGELSQGIHLEAYQCAWLKTAKNHSA